MIHAILCANYPASIDANMKSVSISPKSDAAAELSVLFHQNDMMSS